MYLSMQTKALRTEGQIVLKYNITLHMVSIRLTACLYRTTRSTTYKLCPKELVQEHAFFMVSAGVGEGEGQRVRERGSFGSLSLQEIPLLE